MRMRAAGNQYSPIIILHRG